ncbi:uncharacterized protein LOC103363153 [Stegastes partitus]|uniref:Uncharacterized protein LOC103363153 n=1 Tax=Stegastes partitus TaxID=144197 RepID=A0A9Y4N8Q9_9TELE|nr:PREDICTED: uncharacterized protein LOC103363153 [Stegastes partitus]
MPRLTVIYPKSQGLTGPGGKVGLDCGSKWMEEAKEEKEGEPAERSPEHGSNQAPAEGQAQHTWWSQTLRTLRPWYSWAPVGAVLLVCQLEALLHPSGSLLDTCWALLLLCLLWGVLGGCIHALKCRLQPGQEQGENPQRPQQEEEEEVVTENWRNQCSRLPPTRSPGLHLPLTLALADSLLLCVLQEPLSNPSVPHIQALLSRLESVSHALEKADVGSEVTLEEVDGGSMLTDKLKLMCRYLRQRTGSLRALVQVQEDFEASVKDLLQGLDGLWAQLEELHAGVTLSKRGSRDQVDVASAQTDAETLFAVLTHHRNRLESCQAHLNNSTQRLQELTWSHTHTSNSLKCSSESVWPELLLQSNIEQFDKVQESFISLEQQTSTFQAHLEGLGKGNQEGHAGPLAHANGARESPQTSRHVQSGCTSEVSQERSNSTSASSSVCSADAETETDGPHSLCERSALHFTSTIGLLRRSGRRK